MDILKIIAIGLITVLSTVMLKQVKPELAIFVSISGGLVIIFMIINNVSGVLDSFKQIVSKTEINTSLFKCVFKIIGIGYLSEFGSNICLDAGSSSIADKISFAGKISILVLCLPIVSNLIEMIIEILP